MKFSFKFHNLQRRKNLYESFARYKFTLLREVCKRICIVEKIRIEISNLHRWISSRQNFIVHRWKSLHENFIWHISLRKFAFKFCDYTSLKKFYVSLRKFAFEFYKLISSRKQIILLKSLHENFMHSIYAKYKRILWKNI